MPASTPGRRVLVLLRSGDQFLTRAGRFLITFSDQGLDEASLPQIQRSLIYGTQDESQQSRQSTCSTLEEVAARGIPTYSQSVLANLSAQLEPTRTTYWLHGCFEEYQNTHTSQERIREAYETSFPDAEDLLPSQTFFRVLKHTFPTIQLERLEGSEESFIINGLRPRKEILRIQGLDNVHVKHSSDRSQAENASKHLSTSAQTSGEDEDTTLVETAGDIVVVKDEIESSLKPYTDTVTVNGDLGHPTSLEENQAHKYGVPSLILPTHTSSTETLSPNKQSPPDSETSPILEEFGISQSASACNQCRKCF